MSYLVLLHDLVVISSLTLFAIASLQDWALRLVSNKITLAIAFTGILIRLLDGGLILGITESALVLLVAFCIWRKGWLGGADVKLFAAGALIVPPAAVISFVLVSCLAGGVLAIFYVCVAYVVRPPNPQRPANRLRRYLRLEQRRMARHGPLPYATAISAGAYFTLLVG